MGKRSISRLVNGIVSAVLVVFFLAHGVLGGVSLVSGVEGTLTWLVWVGVALVVVHVMASVVTSREQLADEQRPPSARKKRHLALKWTTGVLLALCAAAHVIFKDALAGRVAMVLVAVALAVHACVGAKSLLKDVGVDRRYKMAFRVVVCIFVVAFVSAAVCSAL